MTSFGAFIDRSRFKLEKRWLLLARLAIVTVLLAAISALGLLFPGTLKNGELENLILLVAGAITVFAVLILYRLSRFEYGILAIPITAGLFNFYALPTGTESKVVFSLVVGIGMVGIWILQLVIPNSGSKLKPSSINVPVFAFIAANFVSYVWGNLLRDPLVVLWNSFPLVQLAALAINVILPLLALMVANKIQQVRWLVILTWLVVAIGTLAIFSNLAGLPLERIYSNGTRGVFIVWAGVLTLGLALFNERLPGWLRAALLVVPAGWLYYTFIRHTFFLSGWVPLGLAGLAVIFLRSKRLFLVALLFSLVLAALNWTQLYEKVVISNQREGSAQRIDLWRTNIRLVSRHPLFGTGPAGYAVYYMTYNPQDARSTHNNYFDILAQTGFVGFIIFLWMMASFGLVGWQVWKAVRGRRDFMEAYTAASLAGLGGAMTAMMLGDWVLPFAYNQTITGFDNASFTWILLGGMVSLHHILKAQGELPEGS